MLLIIEKREIDGAVLLEAGAIEMPLVNEILSNFTIFYQAEENAWGSLILLFRASRHTVTRVKCNTPSVCVVDVKLESYVRAEELKMGMEVLSPLIKNQCVSFVDFNIDLVDPLAQSKTLLLEEYRCAFKPVPITRRTTTHLSCVR